jgi:hypothetical protein
LLRTTGLNVGSAKESIAHVQEIRAVTSQNPSRVAVLAIDLQSQLSHHAIANLRCDLLPTASTSEN